MLGGNPWWLLLPAAPIALLRAIVHKLAEFHRALLWLFWWGRACCHGVAMVLGLNAVTTFSLLHGRGVVAHIIEHRGVT